jgi:hypothetical protein
MDMKILIAAVALTIASPAFAQSADPHAGHKGHGQGHEQGHGQHKDCCKEKDADGTRKDCCEKAKDGKAMECCKKHTEHGADAHVIKDKNVH